MVRGNLSAALLLSVALRPAMTGEVLSREETVTGDSSACGRVEGSDLGQSDNEDFSALALQSVKRSRQVQASAPEEAHNASSQRRKDISNPGPFNLHDLPLIVENTLNGRWNSMPCSNKTREAVRNSSAKAGNSDARHSSGKSDYSEYDIDPNDFRKYKNGQHRRPTDPPTKAEIIMVQQFLFGRQPFKTMLGADALFDEPQWQLLRPVMKAAGIGGLHPATIGGVLDKSLVTCPPYWGKSYEELVDKKGVDEAFSELLKYAGLRCRTNGLWNAYEVGVEVPDRQHILDVEAAIEAGTGGYPMRRILSVRMKGGYHAKTKAGADYTTWGSELFIAVDVADPNNLKVVPKYLDVYEIAVGYGITPPSKAPLDETSTAYLHTAMSSLYLDYETMGTTNGLPSNYLPKYNGNSGDFEGVPLTYIMKFAQPFRYKFGNYAYLYGKEAKEWIMSAELTNLRYESVPIDGHAIQTGANIGQMPLTFLYAINQDGDYINPEQTLPDFDGGRAKSAAMSWYGRGLTFNVTAGLHLLAASAAHMGVDVSGTALEGFKKIKSAAMYAEVADIVSLAIFEAWGYEEPIPGTGFRPGVLQRALKHGHVVSIPADVVKHSFDTPSFVNHATAPAFHTDGSPFLPPGTTRDARDNPSSMAPPRDKKGRPQYAANGPPLRGGHDTSAVSIDGYAVTYNVGMKWKFLMSFDRKAGLTFWNVRMQLPPSKKDRSGREYPLLFRANVPNFGTDYATNSMGNPHGYSFLESHYEAATASLKGASCKGKTLPLFKHRGGGGPHLQNKFGVEHASYSTLGVPGVVDPLLGLPLQGFASFETGTADDVIIDQAICIEEHSMGPNNWHMYAIQTERCLTVSGSTISDAYNVVVKGEFCNTGHLFFGQDLQGKPASTGAAGINSVGGAYASKGRGGYAHNHLHWAVVALEGFVGGGENVLQVIDAEQDGDTDVFGMAFNFLTKTVRSAKDSKLLNYDHATNRAYRIAGIDTNGKVGGGLKVESHCWGNKIKLATQNFKAGIPIERTYYGNHWWLRDQDVFVLPVNQTLRRRDDMDLLSRGRVGQHYDLYRSKAHAQACTKDFQGSFAMFSVMKMRHNVQAEELPIQAAFKKHGLMLKPHFLHGFNMDILMRYDPAWNRFFENNFIGTGGAEYTNELTYTSEFSQR